MKVCSICNKENNNVDGNFCIFCGGELVEKIEEKKVEQKINNKKSIRLSIKNNTVLYIIMTIVLIALIGVGIYTFYLTDTYENKINDLEFQIKMLKSKNSILEKENSEGFIEKIKNSAKADFLDKNIVFVIDGYGDYYYTYDQMKTVTQGVEEYSYWAYNKEAAISRGYRAWK